MSDGRAFLIEMLGTGIPMLATLGFSDDSNRADRAAIPLWRHQLINLISYDPQRT